MAIHQEMPRQLLCALTTLLLVSCGGGGGDALPPSPPPSSSLRITFSTTAMSFTATSPFGSAAAAETLTGTLVGQGSGTLYILVQHNNPELGTLSPVTISGTSGSVTLQPQLPIMLGVGTHTGTLVVRACLDDPTCNTGQISGSPQTVTLRYDVPDIVAADTVTPKVVLSAAAGTMVLRGHGFTAATTVLVGTQAATSVAYVSPTELRVGYPALAAGNHAITVSSMAGATFGQLTVVDPVTYPAQFIAHATNPEFVVSQIYDPVRHTLYMVNLRPDPAPSRVVSYRFASGAWEAPVSVNLPDVRQVMMSHDNSRLYALVSRSIPPAASIVELDPVTLATLATTSLPSVGAVVQSMVRVNDGNLLLPRSSGPPMMFSSVTRQTINAILSSGGRPLVSADGGQVFLIDAGSAVKYTTSDARFVSSALVSTLFNSTSSTTTSGPTKYQSGAGVYDAQVQLIGVAPGAQVAAVIRPDGTRLYTLDGLGFLRTYDLTVAPVAGGMFPALVEIGTGAPLAGVPGGESDPPHMSITPDGGTIFISGHLGWAIQPAL